MNMIPSYNVSDHNYDALHAIGNVLEDLVRLMSGKQRIFLSGKLPFYINSSNQSTTGS